jgi:sirohydrochlorin ferrochelatase
MKNFDLPVLIVSHGQPSDPAPAAQELDLLAESVAKLAGGRAVLAATLAQEGALVRALAQLGPKGVVFPMFMSGGWFTRVALGEKLRAAGGEGWQVLEPFGCETAVHDLAREVVAAALQGQDLARAQVLIAAHGSFKSPAPSDVAASLARSLKSGLGLARCEAAFIDQTPQLAEVTGFDTGAICLPFFAAMGGHVTDDIPRALEAARFGGRVLPPLGLHPDVPKLIAAALVRATPVCAQTCRYSVDLA